MEGEVEVEKRGLLVVLRGGAADDDAAPAAGGFLGRGTLLLLLVEEAVLGRGVRRRCGAARRSSGELGSLPLGDAPAPAPHPFGCNEARPGSSMEEDEDEEGETASTSRKGCLQQEKRREAGVSSGLTSPH